MKRWSFAVKKKIHDENTSFFIYKLSFAPPPPTIISGLQPWVIQIPQHLRSSTTTYLPYKSVVKTFIKKYLKVLSDYTNQSNTNEIENIQTALGITYSKIDKAVKRGVFHSNKAARIKSKLALKTINIIKK